jgi:cytochrome c peroxidase
MLQSKLLVGVALCCAGCALDTYSADPATPEIGRLQSAIGDEEKNDFRNRKTDNKTLTKRKEDCSNDPRVALGLVSQEICVGADLFFRDAFGGNGRACGSCHTAQFDFTISPEFIASLAPDDPLFVAENDPALAGLERPDLMRNFGLILENVDGAEDPTNKFVMRSVPHCFSLATSITPPPINPLSGLAADGSTQPPIQRTGWSGDGAPTPGGLKQFQLGAITQHYTKSLQRIAGTDFTLPGDEPLTRIEDFLRSIGRSSEVMLANVTLSDPGAEAGRVKFLGSRCNGCHSNAGANVASGANFNFDTGVERARLSVLDTMNIPRDGGFGAAAQGVPFNHDANGDGTLDSFGDGRFNTPPLIEAADTPPFFHENGAATIEDAIRFYTTDAFKESLAGGGNAIALTEQEIADMGKFLRVMNASFNLKLAAMRLDATVKVAAEYKNHFKGLQYGLLDAARAELLDARSVISDVMILPAVQTHLNTANQAITTAFSNSSAKQREDAAALALAEVTAAAAGLGTGSGLDFPIGQGSLMF